MDAEIVVRFRALNICSERDLKDEHMTLEQMVRAMVTSEGILGICEDDYQIVSVSELKPHSQETA